MELYLHSPILLHDVVLNYAQDTCSWPGTQHGHSFIFTLSFDIPILHEANEDFSYIIMWYSTV
jgi:hypothetical protein